MTITCVAQRSLSKLHNVVMPESVSTVLGCMQFTSKALRNLLVFYHQPAQAVHEPAVLLRLQLLLVDCLLSNTLPTELQRQNGQLAFSLAAQCLCGLLPLFKQAEQNYLGIDVPAVPEAYWTMLGMFLNTFSGAGPVHMEEHADLL